MARAIMKWEFMQEAKVVYFINMNKKLIIVLASEPYTNLCVGSFFGFLTLAFSFF
jgi:hypothetical protein